MFWTEKCSAEKALELEIKEQYQTARVPRAWQES